MRLLVLVAVAVLFTATACEEQSEEERLAEVVVESIARIREQEAWPPPGYQLPPPGYLATQVAIEVTACGDPVRRAAFGGIDYAARYVRNRSDVAVSVLFSVDFLKADGSLLKKEAHSVRGVQPGSRADWSVSYRDAFFDYAERCSAQIERVFEQ